MFGFEKQRHKYRVAQKSLDSREWNYWKLLACIEAWNVQMNIPSEKELWSLKLWKMRRS